MDKNREGASLTSKMMTRLDPAIVCTRHLSILIIIDIFIVNQSEDPSPSNVPLDTLDQSVASTSNPLLMNIKGRKSYGSMI